MFEIGRSDRVPPQKLRRPKLVLFSVGLLALVPTVGLLLSGYARVREASDGAT
jgi:hypothetical protein